MATLPSDCEFQCLTVPINHHFYIKAKTQHILAHDHTRDSSLLEHRFMNWSFAAVIALRYVCLSTKKLVAMNSIIVEVGTVHTSSILAKGVPVTFLILNFEPPWNKNLS